MKLLNKLFATIKKNPIYVLIFLFWAVGLFFRVYRQDQLLGFYFDQGRDAKMAADIISGRNLPAIGPTTGIEGLFLGPFWYYLITPGYFFGKGDPAIAANFIAFIESLTIPGLFILLSRFHNRKSATLASFFWAFSYYLIRSSRWFSNPTTLPFFVVCLMYLLGLIFIEKKPKYWPIFALITGICLQLEAASAIFFFPIVLVIIAINFKTFQKIKISQIIYSVIAFFALLAPQALFEIKNNFLVSRTFIGFLTGKVNSDTGKSWAIPTMDFVLKRLNMYYETLFSKLDTNTTWISNLFFVILVIGLILIVRKFSKNKFFQIPVIWLFVPLLLLLFFVGNYGTLYDYYLTGFFPAFIILFSVSISLVFSNSIVFLMSASAIVVLFISANIPFVKNYITAGADGPENITLGNQSLVVKYICDQNKNIPYNLDIYVPPVITHPYDYLFYWYTQKHLCNLETKTLITNLYTFYEVDPPHPERLDAWLKRQAGIGKVVSEQQFGGITVQKRTRIIQ